MILTGPVMKAIPVLGSLLVLSLHSLAVTETHNFSPNSPIPDGNPSGLANTQMPATNIVSLTSVVISVSISGTPDTDPRAFNGDLYAYLTHGSGFSVLLNRVGRTAQTGPASFGYGDNGLNVTFSDSAANDIHLYQNVMAPPAGTPLTGTWQPDARSADPDMVLGTSPRSAFLSSFNLLDARGAWTLFVADLSSGEEHTLNTWTLELTGAVPEPGSIALLSIGIVLVAGSRRRERPAGAEHDRKA